MKLILVYFYSIITPLDNYELAAPLHTRTPEVKQSVLWKNVWKHKWFVEEKENRFTSESTRGHLKETEKNPVCM